MKEGIDAVIVDSVLKIRNGLTKNAKASEAPAWPTDGLTNGVNGVNGSVVV